MNGKQILSEKTAFDATKINLSTCNPGIYFLRTTGADNKTEITKLIKK